MSPEIPPQPNTPAGQDHPTPEEKGQSATVDALANAAGRGTPSAEAVKLMHVIRTHGTRRGAEFALNDKKAAQLIDTFAADCVEQAVAQERERGIWWLHEWGRSLASDEPMAWGDCIKAIESGRPKS